MFLHEMRSEKIGFSGTTNNFMNTIRPEHRKIVADIFSIPSAAHLCEFPESVAGALIIADEIQRSTKQICKALENIDSTLNKVGFAVEQH
jgi:hypothetical protein